MIKYVFSMCVLIEEIEMYNIKFVKIMVYCSFM